MSNIFIKFWYVISYYLFFKFSGAHNKPSSDSVYTDTYKQHQNNLFYRLVRYIETKYYWKPFLETQPVSQTLNVPFAQAPFSQEGFQILSNGKTTPVVFKGLIHNTYAVQHWSSDYFSHKNSIYGDTQLLTLKDTKQSGYTSFTDKVHCEYMSLRDSIQNMQHIAQQKENSDEHVFEKIYVNNVTDIFTQHPELVNDLELDTIRHIDTSINQSNWLKVNMFMGGPGTGSSLHCAVGGNFFFNVHGKKRWVLIHPKYTPLLESTPAHDFSFVISGHDFENKESLIHAHIPYYEVILEPGDVLFVPPWWWHYVKNETDFTIGCAVRDHTIYTQSFQTNRMFMWMSPYIFYLHPWVLSFVQAWKGNGFLRNRSMQSDTYIMKHLSGIEFTKPT